MWRHGRARAVAAVAGAAVIAVLAWRLGAGPFQRALSSVTLPALAVALGIGAGTTVLSALRWVRAARLLGLSLAPAQALNDYYAAIFLNAVLPGGVLGDVRRAARHGRDVGSLRAAAGALLLERSAGQVVLVAAAAVVWFGPGRPLAAATILTGAVAAVWRRGIPMPAVREAVAMIGASVAVLAGHIAMFVLAARVAGVGVPVGTLVPTALAVLLAMSLPLSIAGWGAREGAAAWAFAGAGLGAGRGVTVAVVYGLFALVASLPGALVVFGRRSFPVEPAGEAAPRADDVLEAADLGEYLPTARLAGGVVWLRKAVAGWAGRHHHWRARRARQ